MKSKEIKINKIQADNLLYSYSAKPTAFLIACIFFGCFLFFNVTLKYLGIILVVNCTFLLCFSSRRKILDFHKEFLILYSGYDRSVAQMIYYDEIKDYHIESFKGKDLLYIFLENGTFFQQEIFARKRIMSDLIYFTTKK